MGNDLKPGDKVTYRVGRGRGKGTVANVSAGMVTINTAKGKSLLRKLSEVVLIVEVASDPEAGGGD